MGLGQLQETGQQSVMVLEEQPFQQHPIMYISILIVQLVLYKRQLTLKQWIILDIQEDSLGHPI